MFNGTINIVTDINLAAQCGSQGCKVIYVGELNPNLPPQFIPCPMLLPPYEALNAEIEGNMEAYAMTYNMYLDSTKECYDTIMTILSSALFLDQHIIVYIENADEFSHKNFLMSYILNRFGVCLGSDTSSFNVVRDYIPLLTALIYDFLAVDIVDPNTVLLGFNQFGYLINIPNNYPYAGYLLNKLMKNIGCENINELEQYYNHIMKFKVNDDMTHSLVIWRDK